MSDRPRWGSTRLATRFLLYYALAYLVLIGLTGTVIERTTRDALIADEIQSLELGARLASTSIPDDPAGHQGWAEAVFAATSYRTTLIDEAGVVLADSHSDPALMVNHGDRPEVVAAKEGAVGSARRVSASTGFEQLYVAIPPDDGLIVRVSVPVRVIDSELSVLRESIIVAVLVVGLIGVLVVALVARRTAEPIARLTDQSREVARGRLDVSPRRSRVRELDQLGMAISKVAETLGARLGEAEAATATLERVLGAIPQGTILVDENDRLDYANQAARELFGPLPDDLGSLAPLPLQSAVREARARGRQETRVFEHGRPSRRVRGVATPLPDDSRVLLMVMDVTEADRADSIRKDFVANASHELKTPVSTIIAAAEAMQIALSRGDGSAMVFAGRVEQSARQLDRLVGDLLDLSRLEREVADLAPVRVDLLARDEVGRVRVRADEKRLSLELEADELVVPASRRDLAVALRNLLDNAIRHTPEGGRISVTVTTEDGVGIIRVADTGEGIPTRDHDRVFERFYRVDSARSRDTGGTGLGLAIVKHVAETHGGTVGLRSELGVGSTFTIRLPLPEGGSGG